MAAHALLGPSSADRWLNCPPSVRATEHVDDIETDYAREGTLIHALAEAYLRAWIDNGDVVPDYEMDTLRANKFFSTEANDAALYYVAICKERYLAALAKDPSAQIRIERRVDLTDAIPEGFGTVDCFITYLDTVEVIDLKGGKGVFVSAYENSQTRIYAYGVIKQVEILFDIKNVVCTIVQPRMDNVSEEKLTRDELVKWIEETVKPGAKIAWAGKGEFKAGDWCQFCKIRGTCRARAKQNLESVSMLFAQPNEPVPQPATLTPEELGKLYPALEEVSSWVSATKAHMLALITEKGTEIPGVKVVLGRATRKIINYDGLVDSLKAAKIPDAVVYEPPTLLPITKLEGALGKAKFKELAGPFVEKTDGKPTLAPESDRREAINSVAEAAALFTAAKPEEQ